MEERDALAEIQALRDEIGQQHADYQELLFLRSENQALRSEMETLRTMAEHVLAAAEGMLNVMGMTAVVTEEGEVRGDRHGA